MADHPVADNIEEQLRAAGMSPGAASSKMAMFRRVALGYAGWRQSPPPGPTRSWFVPGRIELLGKHTDYAGGRSLLCAAERGFCLLASRRSDARVRLLDVDWHSEAEFLLGSPCSEPNWAIYPATVARRLVRDFPELQHGVDVAFASDLPRAAGMSSSSALVIASFLALAAANELADAPGYLANIHSREDLAGYLAAVESGRAWGPWPGESGVGTHGGSEDHTAILCCQAGRWSQYSFCPVRLEQRFDSPPEHMLVIGVSGVVAAKTGAARSAYNRATRSAEALLAAWNAATQRRDATLGAVAATHPQAAEQMRMVLRTLPPEGEFTPAALEARWEQFVQESEVIIPGAATALQSRQWESLGAWVEGSQQGAELGLGNQTPETVALVGAARRLGAVAASAFGAGFGGAVWALAERWRVQEFRHAWQSDYRGQFAQRASDSLFFLSGAGPAALELNHHEP